MIKHNMSKKIIPERIVVMGAGGFIGASLVKKLESKKIPFLALTSEKLNLLDSDASIRLTEILNPEDTLVMVSAIAPCKDNEMLLQNILMMKVVCEAIEKKQPKHVVYISSDAVYSDSPDLLTENSIAQPESVHGIMHLSREVMLKQVYNGPLAILRPSLIYGAEDTHNGYGPNQFLRLAIEGREINLFGEGEEQRDHVYIKDVIDILYLIILYRSEGIMNIATGVVISFKVIAQMVSKYFNPAVIINSNPRVGPMPHNGYRPFDSSLCLNTFSEFCYTPFEDGLEITFKKLQDHHK